MADQRASLLAHRMLRTARGRLYRRGLHTRCTNPGYTIQGPMNPGTVESQWLGHLAGCIRSKEQDPRRGDHQGGCVWYSVSLAYHASLTTVNELVYRHQLENLSRSMGVPDCLVIQAKIIEKLPELRPRYPHRRGQDTSVGLRPLTASLANQQMPLDRFMRKLNGRPEVVVFNNVFECIDYHSTALHELAKIWESGTYIHQYQKPD